MLKHLLIAALLLLYVAHSDGSKLSRKLQRKPSGSRPAQRQPSRTTSRPKQSQNNTPRPLYPTQPPPAYPQNYPNQPPPYSQSNPHPQSNSQNYPRQPPPPYSQSNPHPQSNSQNYPNQPPPYPNSNPYPQSNSQNYPRQPPPPYPHTNSNPYPQAYPSNNFSPKLSSKSSSNKFLKKVSSSFSPQKLLMIAAATTMLRSIQTLSIGRPDPKVGLLVAGLRPGSRTNPDELGSYLEGDLLQLKPSDPKTAPLWADAVVYYKIDGSFDSVRQERIKLAMNEIENNTCVRFKERTSEPNYISIVSGDSGCWSMLGRSGGKQELNLQPNGCLNSHGIPIHEMLHALGLPHEQSRKDRDTFVKINPRNIMDGRISQFQQNPAYDGIGVPYDYSSIMHYGKYAFSRNGQETISLQKELPEGKEVGQRKFLAPSDIAKINSLYNCETVTDSDNESSNSTASTSTTTTTTTTTTPKPSFFSRIFG